MNPSTQAGRANYYANERAQWDAEEAEARASVVKAITHLQHTFEIQGQASIIARTLKQVIFSSAPHISNQQLLATLIVANEHQLNPFTKEIFAFPSQGGIIPYISVDGWIKIARRADPNFRYEFEYGPMIEAMIGGQPKKAHEWVEARVIKSNGSMEAVREYFDECYLERTGRNGALQGPWQTHPKRMHRHRALIQCLRYSFGISGIYEEDEARDLLYRAEMPTDIQFNPDERDQLVAEAERHAHNGGEAFKTHWETLSHEQKRIIGRTELRRLTALFPLEGTSHEVVDDSREDPTPKPAEDVLDDDAH